MVVSSGRGRGRIRVWACMTGGCCSVLIWAIQPTPFTSFTPLPQYPLVPLHHCHPLNTPSCLPLQEAALRCLQESAAGGRLSLKARWLLALLLIQVTYSPYLGPI